MPDGELSLVKLLEIHEATIIRVIEMNTRNLNQRIDEVMKEVFELKRSANFQEEFCQVKLEPIVKKMQEFESTIATLRNSMPSLPSTSHLQASNANLVSAKIMQDLTSVKEKIVDLENRSRRNNLRVDGLPENEGETWEQTEAKLKELINLKLGLDGDSMLIERAHRVGKRDGGRPRVVVARFLNWKEKNEVLQNSRKLQGSGIYLNDDFAEETVRRRKELLPVMKKMREQGHFAILKVDKLITKEHNL